MPSASPPDLSLLLNLLADATTSLPTIANALDLPITRIAELLQHPDVQQALKAIEQIGKARERILTAQARPEVIQTLAFNATRESADPETQRKSASLLARLVFPTSFIRSTTNPPPTGTETTNPRATTRHKVARGAPPSTEQPPTNTTTNNRATTRHEAARGATPSTEQPPTITTTNPRAITRHEVALDAAPLTEQPPTNATTNNRAITRHEVALDAPPSNQQPPAQATPNPRVTSVKTTNSPPTPNHAPP